VQDFNDLHRQSAEGFNGAFLCEAADADDELRLLCADEEAQKLVAQLVNRRSLAAGELVGREVLREFGAGEKK